MYVCVFLFLSQKKQKSDKIINEHLTNHRNHIFNRFIERWIYQNFAIQIRRIIFETDNHCLCHMYDEICLREFGFRQQSQVLDSYVSSLFYTMVWVFYILCRCLIHMLLTLTISLRKNKRFYPFSIQPSSIDVYGNILNEYKFKIRKYKLTA